MEIEEIKKLLYEIEERQSELRTEMVEKIADAVMNKFGNTLIHILPLPPAANKNMHHIKIFKNGAMYLFTQVFYAPAAEYEIPIEGINVVEYFNLPSSTSFLDAMEHYNTHFDLKAYLIKQMEYWMSNDYTSFDYIECLFKVLYKDE